MTPWGKYQVFNSPAWDFLSFHYQAASISCYWSAWNINPESWHHHAFSRRKHPSSGTCSSQRFISIRITWSSPCPLDFIERKWGDSVPQSGLSTGSNILLTGSRSAANMIFVHRRKIPYLGRWVDGQESGEMTDFRMSFWVVSESLLYLERKKKKWSSRFHHVAIVTHYHFLVSLLILLLARVYFNWQDDQIQTEQKQSLQ